MRRAEGKIGRDFVRLFVIARSVYKCVYGTMVQLYSLRLFMSLLIKIKLVLIVMDVFMDDLYFYTRLELSTVFWN